MNFSFKKSLKKDRAQFWDNAEHEWKQISIDQKKYIAYLYFKKETYTSDSNSWCLYCLGITDQIPTGPLQYSGGGGLCDIDMDFCELRRNEVIQYVADKYGHDNVAHIGTYGSLKSKAAIRAVAKTLGHSYELGDKLARLTLEPIEGKAQSLSVCYEKVPELNNLRNGLDSDEKSILTWAESVEDRIRSFGTHASGIVIADQPINELIPLYPGKDGTPTTQFEMYTVEDVGLIKFDFLGLRALTTIQRCVELVEQRQGVSIDPLQIPIDDADVYTQLRSGDVTGIFQLEGSSGIQDLLMQIRPHSLEDIAILVAVYRPGPLESEMLQHYLKVRAGEANPQYIIPELKPILEETDGMLIYQEQILEICKQLAGYSMGEADMMRRAIGKKKEKEMEAQHDKFITGMQEHSGISEQDATKVWKDIESFASYGFNRAHAACYGYISYQMAWLKHHYPLEFMCACLISDSDENDKVIKYINYCKNHNINIHGPDINSSMENFSIDGTGIRFGLSPIKNLGKAANNIIKEREQNGLFLGITDLCNRISSGVNRRQIESLVRAGAFESIKQNSRASLLDAIDRIWDYKQKLKSYESKLETYNKRVEIYNQRQKDIEAWNILTSEEKKIARAEGKKKPGKIKIPVKPDQIELPDIQELDELPDYEILSDERELTGFFISGHPLDNITMDHSARTIADVKQNCKDGDLVSIFAVPAVINEITTKKTKKKMAFLSLEDMTGTIEGVLFPQIYAYNKDRVDIKIPARYFCEVGVTEADDQRSVKLKVKKVTVSEQINKEFLEPLELDIDIQNIYQVALKLMQHEGEDVIVRIKTTAGSNEYHFIPDIKCKGSKSGIKQILKEYL